MMLQLPLRPNTIQQAEYGLFFVLIISFSKIAFSKNIPPPHLTLINSFKISKIPAATLPFKTMYIFYSPLSTLDKSRILDIQLFSWNL